MSLADTVRRQWKKEAALRRLNDPYPLPVRWQAAPSDLVDTWMVLRRLAQTGAGWSRSTSDRWAADPAEPAAGITAGPLLSSGLGRRARLRVR